MQETWVQSLVQIPHAKEKLSPWAADVETGLEDTVGEAGSGANAESSVGINTKCPCDGEPVRSCCVAQGAQPGAR